MNAITIDRRPLPPSLRSEFDDTPRKEFRSGGLIAGLFFLGLVGGAALIPLDAGAFAEGVVAVSGHRQAVQHRDGGIVTNIMVVEGQQVNKGDVLLKVSASELVAAERGMTGEVISLLANRARLIAEQGRASVIQEPLEFATYTGQDRELARVAMEGQRQLFQARRASLAAERDVLNQRMRQHTEQIGGYSHQMSANRDQQRLIADEIGGLRELLPKGYVAKTRLRAMERVASELDGAHGSYRAEIARAAEARGEARLQMVALEKERITEVATHLRDVQVKLDELQPKLVALREQLARSTVRAPASGRVVGLSVFTEGGVVAAGDKLMEIVPQDRQLIVEGKVSPTDADDLQPGMTTQVRFSGLHERNLPILKGRLTKVSADSFEDERTGARFFRIEVAVAPDELKLIRKVRPDGGLRAGMPAEVMIPLKKRTALAYLLEPVTGSLWKAGREH